jgi:hypothetical protein
MTAHMGGRETEPRSPILPDMRAWACGLSHGGYLYRLSPLNVASARCLSHGLPHTGR